MIRQMKQILFLLTIGILLGAITSCTKSTSSPPGQSWTFASATYTVLACTADSAHATLTAFNTVSGDPYSNIVVFFYDSLPTVSDSFTVVRDANITAAGQVSITIGYMTSGQLTYYGSTGGRDQRVAVTVSGGRLAVTGSNISIAKTTATIDTIPLSFNIKQTQ